MKKGITLMLGVALLGCLLLFAWSLDSGKLPVSSGSAGTQPVLQEFVPPVSTTEAAVTEPEAVIHRAEALTAQAPDTFPQQLHRLSKSIDKMTGTVNRSSVRCLGFRENYMYFTSNYALYRMTITNEHVITLMSSTRLNAVRTAVQQAYPDASIRASDIAFSGSKVLLTLCIELSADAPDAAEDSFSSAVVLIDENVSRAVDTKILTGGITCSDVAVYKDVAIVATSSGLLAYKITDSGLMPLEGSFPEETGTPAYQGLYVDEPGSLLTAVKGAQGAAVYDITYDGNTAFAIRQKDELQFAQMPEFGDANSEGYHTWSAMTKDGYLICTLGQEQQAGQNTHYTGFLVAPIGKMQTDCKIYDASAIYNSAETGPIYLNQDADTGLLCTNLGSGGIGLWKWSPDGTISHTGTIRPEEENLSSLFCAFHKEYLFELRQDLSAEALAGSFSVSRIEMPPAA